jgi:hypothetical protein
MWLVEFGRGIGREVIAGVLDVMWKPRILHAASPADKYLASQKSAISSTTSEEVCKDTLLELGPFFSVISFWIVN